MANQDNSSLTTINGTIGTTTESGGGGIYPPDLFTMEEIKRGGFVLYALGLFYMFCALAIVCDEFFVPALEVRNFFDLVSGPARAQIRA